MSSGQKTNLDIALGDDSTSDELPWPLPPGHVSTAARFAEIVRARRLVPRYISYFDEDLLFLSYGGLAYRPSHGVTREAAELPVGFLFDPRVLEAACRYYPFDTGAVASGKYGSWSEKLKPIRDRFELGPTSSANRRLVHHLFGSNFDYLNGRVHPDSATKPDPLPVLFEFYSTDLSELDVDHRQIVIECVLAVELAIDSTFSPLWVGYPKTHEAVFHELCDALVPAPPPEPYRYPVHRIMHSSEVTAILASEARKFIERRYLHERREAPDEL
jgi:hypothetical protein